MRSAPERFETERLVATRYHEADLLELQALSADPKVMRYVEKGGRSPEKVRNTLTEVDAQWAKKGFGYWVLREKGGGPLGGSVTLFNETATGGVELGYMLAERAWGKGFATEAARAMVAIAFGPLGFTEVWARVEGENTGSLRVVAKLGFQYVRTLPDEQGIPLLHFRLTRRSAPATSPLAGPGSR